MVVCDKGKEFFTLSDNTITVVTMQLNNNHSLNTVNVFKLVLSLDAIFN